MPTLGLGPMLNIFKKMDEFFPYIYISQKDFFSIGLALEYIFSIDNMKNWVMLLLGLRILVRQCFNNTVSSTT